MMAFVGPTSWLLAAGAWAALVWRTLVARGLSELWWACAAVAVATTLQISDVHQMLSGPAGQSELAVLLAQLAGTAAVTLVAAWQYAMGSSPARARVWRRRFALAGSTTSGALIALWLVGAAADSLRTLTFYGYLVVLGVLFVRPALSTAGAVAAGPTRTALQLLMSGVLFLTAWAGSGLAIEAVALAGRKVDLLQRHLLLPAAVALFLLGVCWTLAGRQRLRHDAEAIPRDLAYLWLWLRGARRGMDAPRDLMDLVVEIRDLIWQLQANVPAECVPKAQEAARRRGLQSARAGAFAAAVCLEVGLTARIAAAAATRPADLSQLGGGQSVQQEAHWLAEVWRSTGRAASQEAARLLHGVTPPSDPRAVRQ